MCGFNQSELVFFVWIVVVANQTLATFHGALGQKLCPIGNKAPFWLLLHLVVSKHKNVQFCFSCRIQSDKFLPFKDLNFPNK